MSKDRMINAEKRPVPSTPYAKAITISGQKSMKGGSEFNGKLPKENVIPDGCKGKGFSSK